MRQTPETPYVGPRPFETGEPLYGRDWEVAELRDLLIAKRIVLLHSPSGAGKTSLIQAGLIPALQEEGVRILPIVRVNAEPPSELVEAGRPLNRYVLSTLNYLENDRAEDDRLKPADLAGVQLAEYLERRPGEAADRDPQQEPVVEVLVFDQFEEILTVDPTDVEAKKEFFTQLGVALRDPSRYVLFAMRGDYVGSLDPYLRPVPYLLSTRFRIERLGVEAARLAIQEPARAWDVDFTDGAANKLIDDLRQVRVQRLDGTMQPSLGPHVEPVQLQVVCQLLWQSPRSNAAQITEADVGALGSVDNALGAYFASEVARAADEADVPERAVRDWFDSQLITEQGFRGQVMQGVDQSGGLRNNAIRRLIDAYLVREEKRRGVTWFELAHDRLIEPVRRDNADWRKKNLQEWQRRALVWNRQGQPATLLLAEKEVKEAERWVERHPDEQPTPNERRFLDDSRTTARLEAARRQLRLILGGVALLILLAGLTAWALFSARQARVAENSAVSALNTAEAERKSAIDARAALAANLEAILTAQVPTASPTPTATPRGSPSPGPTPTSTSTPIITPMPTPDQAATATVEALQTQLAQVQATQIAAGDIRTVRVGVHGRNDHQYRGRDFDLIREAKIEAIKMMSFNPPHVFHQLRDLNADLDFIVRLFDDRMVVDYHPTPAEFADTFIPIMRQLQPYATKFEVHSDPNHLAGIEGWGQEDDDARDFSAWFLEVYDRLKQACPWASLGFPGLQIPHRDLEWIEVARPAVEKADWLGVHCYWQNPTYTEGNHLADFWGLRFKYYHEKFPDKDIHITEFANSNGQSGYPVDPQKIAQEYVEYYQELFKYPYLRSANSFIMSAPQSGWEIFSWREETGQFRPVVSAVGEMHRPQLVVPPSPTPTQTRAPTPTATPTPTPDQSATAAVEALQTQLAQVRATQTKVAVTYYTVQAGDTLYSIARRYAVTVDEIMALNHITDPTAIFVGQRLAIIQPGAVPPPVTAPTPNKTVEALQTQEAQAQATQTAVAFPPGRIVFKSDRLSQADLYSVKGDGSDLTRLTFKVAFNPSYSSSADRIVFATDRDNHVFLITVAPYGGEESIIGGQERWDNWDPAFSPDGKRVAFVSSRHNLGWEIYSMNVDGSDVRRLTHDIEAKDWGPAWSPDGKRIAFVSEREREEQVDIWLMDADGGNLVRLTFDGARDEYPDWSPDGRQIAFATNRDGNFEIYVMDVDGRSQRNLTNSPFEENFPAWSPDGNWLAFSRFTTNSEIFVMGLNSDRLINLTNNAANDSLPVWVP